MINAALNLFHSIQPTTRWSVQEILTTVEKWAFQPEMNQVDLDLIQQDSVLSLAEQNVRDSFIEIRNGLGGQDLSISEVRPREATGSEMTETQRQRIFEWSSMVFQTENKILIFLTTRRVARFPEKCHAACPTSVVERLQK